MEKWLCYFEQNILGVVKLNAEFSSLPLEEAKANLAWSFIFISYKENDYLSYRWDCSVLIALVLRAQPRYKKMAEQEMRDFLRSIRPWVLYLLIVYLKLTIFLQDSCANSSFV